MQSLSSRTPRRDPAPSRAAYRMQRMMLTAGVRRFLRLGLPLILIAVTAGIYFSDEARRLDLQAKVADIRRSIEERPEFTVHLFEVQGASLEVTDAIRAVVPLDFPLSSFDIDFDDLHARIAALEAVASVDLQVQKGGALVASVRERVPVALWRSGDGLFLIDEDGFRVAAIASRNARSDLPLLAGAGAQDHVVEALEILEAAAPIAPRLRGVLRVGERRWDLILDRDQRVMLPEYDPVETLLRVIALDEAKQLLERDIAVVDMRNPDRPTLRITPTGIDSLHRARAEQEEEN